MKVIKEESTNKKSFFQQNYNNKLGINIDISYIELAIFYDRTDNIDYELA